MWGDARQHTPDYEFLDVPRGTLTEGPVWLPDRRELLWVDIMENSISRAGLDGSDLMTWTMPGEVGFAVPADDGNLIVGQPDGIHHVDLTTREARPLALLPERDPRIRVNDGKCDHTGRVWFGTMHRAENEPLGKLFTVTPEGVVTDVYHTPMFRPTSCCFAGPELDELVVTSADWGEGAGPCAGRIMRFRPGARGLAEVPARMDLMPEP